MKTEVKIYFKNSKGALVFFVFFIDTQLNVKEIQSIVRSIESEFGYDFHSLIYGSEE